MSKLEKITDATTEGMSEEEINAAIAEAMEEDSLSELDKLRRDNPALQDAWDQISTIRALTEVRKKNDNRPNWQRSYDEIVDGVSGDNEALKEAWNKYYVMKTLLGIK